MGFFSWFSSDSDDDYDDNEVNTGPDNAIPTGMVGDIPILGTVDSDSGEIHWGKTPDEIGKDDD